MATNVNALSEDWEDVADDNFSVVSLPTSDSDESLKTTTDVSDQNGPKCPDDLAENMKVSSIDEMDSLATDKGFFKGEDGLKEQGVDGCPSAPPSYREFDDADSDLDQGSDPTLAHEDMSDVDMDPVFLHQVCTALLKLLDEIISMTSFRSNGQAVCDRREIRATCSDLQQHIRTLEPIMKGYSKHWDPQRALVALPIDPGLYEWMSGLRIELLSIQAFVQRAFSGDSSTSSRDSDLTAGLVETKSALQDFSTQIAGFVPIMQADFDEFYTANLVSDTTTEAQPRNRGSESRNGGLAPSPATVRLRRELYGFKDQIVDLLTAMQPFLDWKSPCSDRALLEGIMASYSQIKASLDIMLSNHASDWIEHGLSGGMTYPEFCRLNPDTIRSLNLELKDVADSLSAEESRVAGQRYLAHSDFNMENERLEVDTTNIDILTNLEEIISSLLQIRNRPARAVLAEYGDSRSQSLALTRTD